MVHTQATEIYKTDLRYEFTECLKVGSASELSVSLGGTAQG